MKYIPLYLAALMLLCLAPMPYGYYTLVRILATVVFGIYAYKCYEAKKEGMTWVFLTLALLFQPFAKVGLGRTVWIIIDVIVAVGLIALFFWEWKYGKDAKRDSIPVAPDNSIKAEVIEDNCFEFKLGAEIFEGWGQMIGFHVVYLPLLMKQLTNKDVLHYRAPYLSDIELANTTVGNNFLLQYLEHPIERGRIKHGFIRTEDIYRGSDGKDKAINRFYPLSSNSGEPIEDQLHKIGKQISSEKSHQERLLGNKERSWDEWGEPVGGGADDHFNSQLDEENTDDLIEEVKERIAKLRQRGISQYILEQLIHPDDRLSRLVITKDYRIILPDYNDMEIKMEPLAKAVYLLFLNHPEGILFKQLPEFRQELASYYNKLRAGGLSDKAIQSVEDVTNPLLNSINEKCARIRGAFVGQFDDHMARHYYIDGHRGEAKKITLPRELVIWE